MDIFHQALDFILHLDVHLENLMLNYQTATYLILCLIIFCETGLVATPFLPGDSLLFAAGAITAKTGILNIWLLVPLLIFSAFLGDNVNYFVGKHLGIRLFDAPGLRRILKREYITKTHLFYEKHGGKTIILARFVPIIRTFAPFVAGLGYMDYKKYITFSISGAVIWVSLLAFAGYFFGGLPFVKENFELVIFAIIGLSLVPIFIEFAKARFQKKPAQ